MKIRITLRNETQYLRVYVLVSSCRFSLVFRCKSDGGFPSRELPREALHEEDRLLPDPRDVGRASECERDAPFAQDSLEDVLRPVSWSSESPVGRAQAAPLPRSRQDGPLGPALLAARPPELLEAVAGAAGEASPPGGEAALQEEGGEEGQGRQGRGPEEGLEGQEEGEAE